MAKSAEPLADFKQRAKRLLKRVRALEPEALQQARLHPLYRGGADPAAFSLSDAQLVVARAEGFDSWPKLAAARQKETPMDNVTFNGFGMRIWVLAEHFNASADFYGETLGIRCSWRSEEQRIATFELGFGPTIVLEVADPNEREAQGLSQIHARVTGMTLDVADIASVYATLKARGVPFMGEPERQYWGGIMAFFQDPGGNWHTLLQRPVFSARVTTPPPD